MSYNVVVVGYGGMGHYHGRMAMKMDKLNLKGIYDIREEPNEDAKANGIYTYPSFQAVLDDKDIDLILIATPNNYHHDIAVACLKSGKNVITEKPAMMNAAELEDVIAVAKESGKLFTVHQNRRWDGDYLRVKKIVNDNIVGKPYFIESRACGDNRGMYGWRGYAVNGGGMLLDWGVHLLDQLLDLIDSPVVSVDASVINFHTPDADDTAKVLLRYENGVTALCEVANNVFWRLPRWHISLEHGTFVWDDADGKSRLIETDYDDTVKRYDHLVYTTEGPKVMPTDFPASKPREIPIPETEGGWDDYYKNIIGVFDGTEELIVRPEQALRVLKVIDLAKESSEQNSAIKCRI